MNRRTPSPMWRSRWAAIGAAVAVAVGGGGLYTTFAASSPSSFVAITPVRVLDTRVAAMGPSIPTESPRLLDVTGSIPTVGADGTSVVTATVVPDGVTAVVANITAVSPTSPGFVSVRPGTVTGAPTTSNINFTAAGAIVPNSVTVEVPTSGPNAGQIQLWFRGGAASTTDLLVDIVGYYTASSAGSAGSAGPAGPAGPAGSTGPAGPRGLSSWETIPSGQTVIGEFVMDYSASSTATDEFSIPFPARAPVAVTSANVNFSTDGLDATIDDDPRCTGSFSAPTAPAGVVCLYSFGPPGNLSGLRGNRAIGLPTSGFLVRGTPVATDTDTFLALTWAYTAP